MIRIHLFISGDVHGVTFRYSARKKAQELGVTGWVKNIPLGVEMILEGKEKEVKEFVEWAKHGPSWARVEGIKIIEEKFKDEFKEFEIRF